MEMKYYMKRVFFPRLLQGCCVCVWVSFAEGSQKWLNECASLPRVSCSAQSVFAHGTCTKSPGLFLGVGNEHGEHSPQCLASTTAWLQKIFSHFQYTLLVPERNIHVWTCNKGNEQPANNIISIGRNFSALIFH